MLGIAFAKLAAKTPIFVLAGRTPQFPYRTKKRIGQAVQCKADPDNRFKPWMRGRPRSLYEFYVM